MALQKKTRKAFEDPNETRFQFDTEGDVAAGYYLGAETFTANGDELTKHRVQTEDGKTVSFLGNYMLNSDLSEQDVGYWIQITYEGQKKSKKGRMFNSFDIQIDPEKRLSA
jgi:hypothetical protein